jgi:hypothetical protein
VHRIEWFRYGINFATHSLQLSSDGAERVLWHPPRPSARIRSWDSTPFVCPRRHPDQTTGTGCGSWVVRRASKETWCAWVSACTSQAVPSTRLNHAGWVDIRRRVALWWRRPQSNSNCRLMYLAYSTLSDTMTLVFSVPVVGFIPAQPRGFLLALP